MAAWSDLRAPAALVVLVGALGCAARPALVGRWEGNAPLGGRIAYEFKGDGTFTQSAATMSALGTIQIQGSGTYKVEGEKVDLTVTAAQDGGQALPTVPVEIKSQPYTWKLQGDTLLLTNRLGQTIALTRAKG